jgi:long-subunit acyl-CoA synthetase (AMP-forming)
VWEKLKVAVEMAVQHEPDEARRHGMQWALGVGKRKVGFEQAGQDIPPELAAEYAKADEAVLSKLRAKLGFSELRWAVSGAAPIAPDTLGFFAALGVPISEIWGMSELSCIATAVAPKDARLGTVGKLLPGLESRIAGDGEFLVRGPLVMKGYRKEPEKTAEAIDSEGWLHTGDIMTEDADGYLRIVDRKKELIINAAGKNMSPANIENTIKASCSLIGGMVTIGEARPYNTALITLDPDLAAGMAAKLGLPDASAEALATLSDLVDQIRAGIAAGNEKLSRVEQIKRFRILPVFWEPGGDELTLTMKLRRKPISSKYAAEIEELYADQPVEDVLEPAG